MSGRKPQPTSTIRRHRLLTVVVGLLLAGVLAGTASAQPAPIEHVAYGPLEREFQEIYPAEAPGSPAVVLIGEGGFHEVKWEALRSEAASLQKHGSAVYLINYPVDSSTEPAFPKEPEAVRNAAEFAKAHGATYNSDPSNLILLGGSAGGLLAVIAGDKLLPPGAVQGVASLSGPMDLWLRVEEDKKSMAKALGCPYLIGCSALLAREWSPIFNVTPCVPMLLFGSEEGDLVPLIHQQEMVIAMESAGCPVTLDVEPKGHAFAYRARANPEIFAFIAAH